MLTNDVWRTDLLEAMDRACRRHDIGLVAYVIMPEHVHLLVIPLAGLPNLPRLLADIKRPTPVRIKRHLIEAQSSLSRD